MPINCSTSGLSQVESNCKNVSGFFDELLKDWKVAVTKANIILSDAEQLNLDTYLKNLTSNDIQTINNIIAQAPSTGGSGMLSGPPPLWP